MPEILSPFASSNPAALLPAALPVMSAVPVKPLISPRCPITTPPGTLTCKIPAPVILPTKLSWAAEL